ncbi:hypothetical protein THAOC_11813 [Thalassiosira oceanica]|uniref:Peroxisomal membrane protein PEX16 n=1 Tax=Thalassiosira oceanica TaxID=159749 RepID=K0SPH8_THAOC|nr:hypothetical protein THAOC_11813 [Thalassiosira oceanica]|eukprot:EJK67185.1 hypothetical protein THAOC_11813 [Thalassiosira oceanica]
MTCAIMDQADENTDERMDKAWHEAEAQVNSSRSTPSTIKGEHKPPREKMSPLMARDDTEVEDENDQPRQFLVPQDCRSEAVTPVTPAQVGARPTNSIILRYRSFLQKHEPSLDILENVTERVFYGYLFKNDLRGIKSEIYYSVWNSFRFVNEIILSGWGDGLGTTVGTRREWLATTSDQEHGSSVEDMVLAKLNMAIPILRILLSATTCLYPAFEAWSRRSARRNLTKSSYGTPLYIFNNGDTIPQTTADHELPESTTDLSPKRRRREWESQMSSAAQMSYRLQRVRNQTSQVVHSLLRRGGELDPYEQVVPLRVADEEAKVAQYVGRRTGRRSVARLPQTDKAAIQSRHPWLTRLTELITNASSSKNKVLYVYAVGEILNILRPLYWSRAEARQWTQRFSTPQIQKRSLFGSCYTYRIWIAYWVSLAMDLISNRLLRNVQEVAPTHGRRGAFQQASASPSASQASLDELEWRRSRHGLYLLRSPMYEFATRPVAVFLGRIISKVPSFGLARWAAEYALDLMSYWNSKRFMLES